jgi:hypothetical protein
MAARLNAVRRSIAGGRAGDAGNAVAAAEQQLLSSSAGIMVDHAPRIAELDTEIARLVETIAGGLLSEALAARLQAMNKPAVPVRAP